ncbi:MAG: ABC transporter permease [Holophaga sp.]|nr:ABC transporter permease [Holophaga sp.]
MNAIWALLLKDLKVFFRDRRALLMAFAAPILLGAFMGFLFNGKDREAAKISVLLVDQDQSSLSIKLAAGLGGDKALELRPCEAAAVRQEIRKGRAVAALLLPKGFGDSATRNFFQSGTKPTLILLVDPSRATEASMLRGLLAQHTMEVVSAEVFGGPSGLSMLKENAESADRNPNINPAARKALKDLYGNVATLNETGATKGNGAPGMKLPYELKEEEVTAKAGVRYNGYAHSFAGMGVQFILFMGIEGGMALLVLRRSALWKRLRTAPIGRHSILVARILSSAVIAAVLMLGIFAVARVVFGVKVQGSFLGFLLITAAFSLFTGAFGLLIAALGRTPEATRGLAILATLAMVMLGGAWVPAFVFPLWLQKFTLVFPTRWALDGLDAMTWRGLGFQAALAPTAVLIGFALVLGVVAWARFPFEENP